VSSEGRGPVTTQRVGQEILFGETAGHSGKEGREASVAPIRVGRLDGVAAAKAVKGESIGQIVTRLDSELVQRRFAELVTADDLDFSAGGESGVEREKGLYGLHSIVAVAAECLAIERGTRRVRQRQIEVAVNRRAVPSECVA